MTVKEEQKKIESNDRRIEELKNAQTTTMLTLASSDSEVSSFKNMTYPDIFKTLTYVKPNGEEEKIANLISHLLHAIDKSLQDEINKLEEENRTIESKEVQ